MDFAIGNMGTAQGVLVNVFLLLGFVSVCSLASDWVARHRRKFNLWAAGLLFGVMAVAAMFSPVYMRSGTVLDCRASVIGAAALLGGYRMALTSMIFPFLYRTALGGVAVWPGLGGMFFAAVLGLCARGWFKQSAPLFKAHELVIASSFVGFGTDLLFLLTFPEITLRTMVELGGLGSVIWVLLIPVSMSLLTTFIVRELHHDALVAALAESDRRMLYSQKMAAVGQFAHRVSHSILNALTVIVCSAEQAKHEPSSVKVMMENILKTVNGLSSLTGDLMAFSNQGAVRFQNMHLSKCLLGVGSLLEKMIGHGVTLSIVDDHDTGLVSMDLNLVEQMIVHLSSNAVDAMSGQGQLTIRVAPIHLSVTEQIRLRGGIMDDETRGGAFSVISVQDTGCGMAEELVPRIFEPFFTTKGRRENSGLGLSSVYNIVQKHRALIDVKTKPGRGTTFLVYFPVVG